MINSTNERGVDQRRTARRVALAGLLTAVALTGGAGVASAAHAPVPIETGYATVVDEGRAAAASVTDCPDQDASTDATTTDGDL